MGVQVHSTSAIGPKQVVAGVFFAVRAIICVVWEVLWYGWLYFFNLLLNRYTKTCTHHQILI